MAKTFTAPFAQTPQTGFAECTGVSTPADDTVNAVLIATAGSEGALLTAVSAIPRATITATAMYLYISKDSGTTKYLIDSELILAHTVATTTLIPENFFTNISESSPVRLEAGDEVYVGISVGLAGGVVFKAEWTDF